MQNNDDIRTFELNFKRDQFIMDLMLHPIENERFIATFVKTEAHSGDAIFQSKTSDQVTKAQWGAYKTHDTIRVTLLANGFLILDEDFDKYRERIDTTIVLYR